MAFTLHMTDFEIIKRGLTLRDQQYQFESKFPDFVCEIVTQRKGVVIEFVKRHREP
jgi:hypothetical protein